MIKKNVVIKFTKEFSFFIRNLIITSLLFFLNDIAVLFQITLNRILDSYIQFIPHFPLHQSLSNENDKTNSEHWDNKEEENENFFKHSKSPTVEKLILTTKGNEISNVDTSVIENFINNYQGKYVVFSDLEELFLFFFQQGIVI